MNDSASVSEGTVKVAGLSHVTLAVSDLPTSVAFYRDILGCDVRATWGEGAYLEAGAMWLCLSHDAAATQRPHPDYTHVAFDVAPASFNALADRVRTSAVIWKQDVREGASLYFLDPDGHKLELHVGTLASRLAHYRANPNSDVELL